MSMCHRCGEHRSHCICTPSKSELKRRAAMGAPERMPLSERIRAETNSYHERGLYGAWADGVAALEQERDTPTPEKLEAWGEWFDDPQNPPVIFNAGKYRPGPLTAGFVLREIARALADEGE